MVYPANRAAISHGLYLALAMLLALGMAGTARPVLAEDPLFIVNEDYPPYEMAEPVNGLRGFDYDLVQEIFTRMGYETDIQFLPWKRALLYARISKSVGILTCAHHPDREEFLLFSNPISSFTSGFYIRNAFPGPVPRVLSDLQGQRVASVTGYESMAALEEAGLRPRGASDTAGAVRMLNAGRFDYLYLARQSTDFVIKQMGWAARFDFHPISTRDFHFCFSRKFPHVDEIAEAFNIMLAQMRRDRRIEAIQSRYR